MPPAGTVTFGGVTTCPSMLPLSQTSAPPAGAGDVSVTVPVVLLSPRILADVGVRDERLGAAGGLPAGNRVSQAAGERYPSSASPASMTTRVGTDTGAVVTPNVTPVPPAGMNTVGGSVIRSVLLLTNVTVTPPNGAGFNSVAVPTTDPPPTTLSWSSAMPQRIGNKPSEFCSQLMPYAARTVPIVAPPTGIVV